MVALMYKRYYAKNGVVAWGVAAGPLDHLFVWEGAEPGVTPASLDALVTSWNAADILAGNVRTRSVYYCQSFDIATIGAVLDAFFGTPDADNAWGRLAYWRTAVFQGGPPIRFPDGTNTPVQVGLLALSLDGAIPTVLDDFDVKADPNGVRLELTLRSADTFTWSIGTAGGKEKAPLWVPLDANTEFVSGAIGLPVSCPPKPDPDHPIRSVRFLYQAAPHPEDMPPPGGGPVPCRVWHSELTDQVDAPEQLCTIVLDPRDAVSAANWLTSGGLNSHIEFGDTVIHSSLFGADAQRFILNSRGAGRARLGIVHDLMTSTGDITYNLNVIFHPEGTFGIVGPAIPPAAAPIDPSGTLNIGARDMLAGGAGTEFFDLATPRPDGAEFTHIEFVRRSPAFLLENEVQPSPMDRSLLDHKDYKAITSHLQFRVGDKRVAVPFHSQAADTPLFELSNSAIADHLRRTRVPYRTTAAAMPVFPPAGYRPDVSVGGPAKDDEIVHFESTHLAQYRRNQPPVAVPAALAPENAPSGKQLAVTPQGLLAEITGGDYSTLFFGNPDSITQRDEFCLRITRPSPAADPRAIHLYNEVQQALAGSQLFMVFQKPADFALSVIAPSTELYARDFSFSVSPDPKTLSASVLIVKYFRGQSLDTLIGKPELWACQDALAHDKDVDAIRALTKFGADIPEPLNSIWTNPDWQGGLVLDLPIVRMPDVIEALRPGLAATTRLRAHHFGLNALPARKADLTPPTTPLPQRPGSVFGLIQYVKTADVAAPATADNEPGPEGPLPAPTERKYAFIVNSLQITFQNSQVAKFQATLFVQFTHLFWDKATTPANGIELDGYYERRPKQGAPNESEDVFSFISPNEFTITFEANSYLKELRLRRAQLNVISVTRANEKLTELNAFIGFDAALTLSEKIANLPIVSVKEIRVSSFGFGFDYVPDKTFTFNFKADGISADIDFSAPGTGGPPLLSFLPVKLKGMNLALGKLLDLSDLNFQPLNFGGIGTKFHFGFLMDLDFGSLGQLAGDLRGLHVPLLLGWGGGSSPGLAFGIQFPSLNAKIDIGIQQFIRLQAKSLNIKRCLDAGTLKAVAIQAVNARVVMFGQAWPDEDVAFLIFIPVTSDRKPSWALGVKNGDKWYVGAGYRIHIEGDDAKDVAGIVDAFEKYLSDVGPDKDVCTLLDLAKPQTDNWSLAARYKGSFEAAIAISDPNLYGIHLDILGLGPIDVLYRRVNSQLGMFSVEYTFPGPARNIQIGVATVRLPTLRLEIYTDGGFLFDFGYPWNNDFRRSCQVEIAVFVGSGGWYYGRTSAAASDLLRFDGGYGYRALTDTTSLNAFRALRLGFAARVGLGRSLTIGILSAQASVTLFGGLEGAAGYLPSDSLFSPTIYALRGFMGLMVDISATVDFAIIRASARILIYAEVGIEIRRVLALDPTGINLCLLTLPVVLFAEVGVEVSVNVEIHIGCVTVSIHLSFSTTWRFQESLGSLRPDPYTLAPAAVAAMALMPGAPLAADPGVVWDTTYKFWDAQRHLTLYTSVLPCLVSTADTAEAGDPKIRTAVVGSMFLPVRPQDNGFADLARFLTGWVLHATSTTDPTITLKQVKDLRFSLNDDVWDAFPPALMTVIGNQFTPDLTLLTTANQEPLAAIPFWPGTVFRYLPAGGADPVSRAPATVLAGRKLHVPMPAPDAAFAEYCQHVISGTLPEIQLLLEAAANAASSPNDPAAGLPWSKIWLQMFTK